MHVTYNMFTFSHSWISHLPGIIFSHPPRQGVDTLLLLQHCRHKVLPTVLLHVVMPESFDVYTLAKVIITCFISLSGVAPPLWWPYPSWQYMIYLLAQSTFCRMGLGHLESIFPPTMLMIIDTIINSYGIDTTHLLSQSTFCRTGFPSCKASSPPLTKWTALSPFLST